jgi:hypothetical protein
MKATRYYQVAEHIFSVMTEPAHLTLMQNYEPFRCSDSGDAVFTLTIDSGEAPAYTEETRQEDVTTYPNKTMIFITHRATVCELCDESISLMPTR